MYDIYLADAVQGLSPAGLDLHRRLTALHGHPLRAAETAHTVTDGLGEPLDTVAAVWYYNLVSSPTGTHLTAPEAMHYFKALLEDYLHSQPYDRTVTVLGLHGWQKLALHFGVRL